MLMLGMYSPLKQNRLYKKLYELFAEFYFVCLGANGTRGGCPARSCRGASACVPNLLEQRAGVLFLREVRASGQ